MQIQIKSVSENQKTSSGGKSYMALELAYKNLNSGKLEGKNLMPFGGNRVAYEVLKGAAVDQIFDVTAEKNKEGFWEWVSAVPSDGKVLPNVPYPAVKPAGKSTYETPEERATRQVLIVRQSSVSSAVAALTPGAKAPLDSHAVIKFAKEIEDYVFGTESSGTQGLIDMTNDIPD